MKEIIEQIKIKAKKCGDKTKEDRARKGAYVDCLVIIKETATSEHPMLSEVRALQGYEPDLNNAMTTQSEGRWIDKEKVLEILEKHFTSN